MKSEHISDERASLMRRSAQYRTSSKPFTSASPAEMNGFKYRTSKYDAVMFQRTMI
jgi:hypothetical protein